MSAKATRARLQLGMKLTEADHAHWIYDAVRPMPVPPSWKAGQRVVGDCSKGCQYLCRWFDAPDCMGNGWQVWGNSSTIFFHLPHIDETEVQVGDIVTFGYWTGEHHAAMVYSVAKNGQITLWNFGRPGEPLFVTLDEEEAVHRGMHVTFCKLMPDDPAPPPTAAEKLRAETGFYAWVAWKLGEGDWATYGKANKKVRPNVPTRISAQWWTRYLQFLANRKKGNNAT